MLIINILVVSVAHEGMQLIALYGVNIARSKKNNAVIVLDLRTIRLDIREVYGHLPQGSTCNAIYVYYTFGIPAMNCLLQC